MIKVLCYTKFYDNSVPAILQKPTSIVTLYSDAPLTVSSDDHTSSIESGYITTFVDIQQLTESYLGGILLDSVPKVSGVHAPFIEPDEQQTLNRSTLLKLSTMRILDYLAGRKPSTMFDVASYRGEVIDHVYAMTYSGWTGI